MKEQTMNPMVKLSALAVMALCAACGVAADPAPAKPAGARVGYMLILFGCEDAVVKAAGIDMHKTLGGPYLGTWHDMIGQKGIRPGKLDGLERGDFDMLLLATPHCYPDAGNWAGAVGLDSTPAILCAAGVKNNPNFRLVWQSYYTPHTEPRGDKKVLHWKPRKDSPDGLLALEKLTDQINEKHGRKVMVISPVEEATCKLIEMVAAGKFPGITDPGELWGPWTRSHDPMWRPGSHLRTLFAYCNVATMYGVSPIGLNPDCSSLKFGGGKTFPEAFNDLAPITEEQRKILQQIVWDTVSNYPYSGVKKP
ncbi:hypothetical protein LBMAG56_54360 [Verrucomicrobiota bacterium]|jgi:hypothetical protein|nr:hypothetical protein LBMAG56_54360 [Verrucomicrobiota bacterium]